MNKLTNAVSILIVSLFFGFLGNAQNLSLKTQTAGLGNEEIIKIVTDDLGNIFHSGTYKDATLIEGVPLAPLSSPMSPPPYKDAYLARHSNGSGVNWAISIGGPSILFVDVFSLTTDAAGNVLLVVRAVILADSLYIGSLLSIPADGSQSNSVLVKLDPQGNLLWSKILVGNMSAANLVTDSNDDFYYIGWQAGPIILDTITISPTYGTQANFISKLDANGNFLWGKDFGSKSNMGQQLKAVINTQNELFISGGWEGDTIFMDSLFAVNPTPGGFFSTDRYIAKFDANGNALWLQREGGLEIEWAASLQVTSGGGLMAYSTVADSTSLIINEGATTVQGPKMLFSKYSGQGMLSSYTAIAHGIDDNPSQNAFTSDGSNYFVTYNYTGSQITIGGTTLNNTGGISGTIDIAIATLDSSANIVSAINVGGIENERCFVLSHNAVTQELLFGGNTASSELVFGSDTLTNTGFLTAEGFIGSTSNSIGIQESRPINTLAVYPNPAKGRISMSISDLQNAKAEVSVYNALGQVVLNEKLVGVNTELDINVVAFTTGVYLIKVTSGSKIYVGKFIKE